jgi:hypothetical protein
LKKKNHENRETKISAIFFFRGSNIKLEAYAFRLLGQKNIKKRATDLMTTFEHVRIFDRITNVIHEVDYIMQCVQPDTSCLILTLVFHLIKILRRFSKLF